MNPQAFFAFFASKGRKRQNNSESHDIIAISGSIYK